MNLRQLGLIFWSRKGIVLLIFSVSVLSALVVSSMLKPRYSATSQVFVNLADPNGATNAIVQPAVVRNYILTQIEAIRSRGVALTVVDQENLVDQPAWQRAFKEAGSSGDMRDWVAAQLQGGLTVMRQAASDIIAITYQSADAASAARFANSFASAYARKDLELRAGPAQDLSRWYEERLKQLRERFAQVETERSQLRFEAISRGDADATGAPDPLTSLTAVYNNARNALIEAKAELEKARSGQNPAADNPELVSLRQQAADAEIAIKRDTPLLGSQHRRIQNLRANLEQANNQIETATRRLRAEIVADKVREVTAAEQRMTEAAMQIKREEGQRNEQARSRASAGAFDRELESLRAQIDTMVQRRERAVVEGASNMGNVSILSPAAIPQQPTWPRIPLILGVASGLGVAFGLAFAFLREMLDRRVRCTDDLTSYCDAPMLGVVSGSRLSRSMARVPSLQANTFGWSARNKLIGPSSS